MSQALKLAAFTTELIGVLATESGLAVGDAKVPDSIPEIPADADFPFFVVDSPADQETGRDLLATGSTVTKTYLVKAVGLSRLQAESARDFARALLDYGVPIETADARAIARRNLGGSIDTDGDLYNANLLIEMTVTRVV